jgi:hypothetical protein
VNTVRRLPALSDWARQYVEDDEPLEFEAVPHQAAPTFGLKPTPVPWRLLATFLISAILGFVWWEPLWIVSAIAALLLATQR